MSAILRGDPTTAGRGQPVPGGLIGLPDLPRRELGDWPMFVTDGKWPDEAGASDPCRIEDVRGG